MFNMHRTVVDNIDEIVRAVYQQGMSDGQRRVVETAANVKVNTPNVGNVQPGNNIEEQLRQIIGESDSMMRFRF
jgi:flagellar basal body P-ring protein FlgI